MSVSNDPSVIINSACLEYCITSKSLYQDSVSSNCINIHRKLEWPLPRVYTKRVPTRSRFSNICTKKYRGYLTTGQSKAVGGKDLVYGLEVGGSTALAVTRSSRGDTLGLGARVPGASRVSGLGADVGLSEASDTALGVVDGGTESADGTAVDTGGRSRAADAGSDAGSGAARDADAASVVVVDGSRVGVSAGTADVAVVTASREDRASEGSNVSTGAGGGSVTRSATVAGRDESTGDGETDGAAATVVDVVGVTTANSNEGGWHLLNSLDLELGLLKADLLGKFLSLSSAAGKGLKNELVGCDVDVVGGDAGLLSLGDLGVQLIKSLLGLLELGERSGDNQGGGTSSSNLGGQGLVSDGDSEVAVNEPGTTERAASKSLELFDDFGGLKFAGDTSMSLLSVQSQVALHGSQDSGVELFSGLSRGTIDDGQEDREGSEEFGELHGEGSEGNRREIGRWY